MAFTEDIISIIVILAVILVAGFMLSGQFLASEDSADTNERFMYDYYSTAADTFFNFWDAASKQPFGIALADYRLTLEYAGAAEGESDRLELKKNAEAVLNAIFGMGNYYLRLDPAISDTTISFVFDGTPSLEAERNVMAQNMPQFSQELRQMFATTASMPKIKIYILSNKLESDMCSGFSGVLGVECHVIGEGQIYTSVVPKPAFGFPTYEAWLNSPHWVPSYYFYTSDWMAGMAYAAKVYLIEHPAGGQREGLSLNIIIPFSDKLSTSSVADSCFTRAEKSDYIACSYCKEECPVARSRAGMAALLGLFETSGAVVIPVFSDRCAFRYNCSLNCMRPTTYASTYIDFPIDIYGCGSTCTGNICDQPKCGGCESQHNEPRRYDNFCFHRECGSAVELQMNELAGPTGGTVLNIQDVSTLPEEILERIDNAISQYILRLGVYDAARARYGFSRTIMQQDNKFTNITMLVYSELFRDDTLPIANSFAVTPHAYAAGKVFAAVANVSDNLGVKSASFNFTVNGIVHVVTMTETEGGMDDSWQRFIASFDSTGFPDGNYNVTLIVTDFAGNTMREVFQNAFVIDSSIHEENYPELVHETGRCTYPEDVNNCVANVVKVDRVDQSTPVLISALLYDDTEIMNATATVVTPSGTVDLLMHRIATYPGNLYNYSVTLPAGMTSDAGQYYISITAEDRYSNTAFFSQVDSFLVATVKIRLLFLPIDYSSSDIQEYHDAISEQVYKFTDVLPLRECRDSVESEIIDNFHANIYDACDPSSCGLSRILSFARSQGYEPSDYKVVVGVRPSYCGNGIAGCSNGQDTIWISAGHDIVLAHEVGHIYGLVDQYCSRVYSDGVNTVPGASGNCNVGETTPNLAFTEGYPNPLSSAQGCNPKNIDRGCCDGCSGAYNVCCDGNLDRSGTGTRSIMSSASWAGERYYDENSYHWLTEGNLDKLPYGEVNTWKGDMSCD